MHSLEEVKSDLKRIVKGREDYEYQIPEDAEECVYMHKAKPSCLIGHLLSKHGLLSPVYDEEPSNGIENIINKYNLPYTKEASAYMDDVQQRQDLGFTWGEAI